MNNQLDNIKLNFNYDKVSESIRLTPNTYAVSLMKTHLPNLRILRAFARAVLSHQIRRLTLPHPQSSIAFMNQRGTNAIFNELCPPTEFQNHAESITIQDWLAILDLESKLGDFWLKQLAEHGWSQLKEQIAPSIFDKVTCDCFPLDSENDFIEIHWRYLPIKMSQLRIQAPDPAAILKAGNLSEQEGLERLFLVYCYCQDCIEYIDKDREAGERPRRILPYYPTKRALLRLFDSYKAFIFITRSLIQQKNLTHDEITYEQIKAHRETLVQQESES